MAQEKKDKPEEDEIAQAGNTAEEAEEGASESETASSERDNAEAAELPESVNADESAEETQDDFYLAAADDHDHDANDYHEHDGLEEHGIFPTWLKVLLILLFGAVAALWGGPRLAPYLPSGLSPVAEFLAPGGVQQAERIDARLTALEERPAPDVAPAAVQSAVAAAMESYDAEVREELDRLRDTVAAVDGSDIEERLSRVETSVEGLEAQIASISERLETTVIDGITQQSAEQSAAFQATLDRLRAEIDTLSARQGTLQQDIDEVAAANTRIREEAEVQVSASQAESAATDIAAALRTGIPFRPAFDLLAGATGSELPQLQALADQGAPSLNELRAAFPELAHASLRASLRADAEGYTGKALAFLRSQVVTRSLKPQEGDSTDAILSRVDAALSAGNLARVMAEADALSEAARAPLAGWLASVRQLAGAQEELTNATAQIARQKS